ncbi:hypothetical protein [Clostridium botulinum]|uniref:hypothetical protein n=1 Tax=Clostridium botulinum TaxID=1491 RepID=UPI00351DF39B
MSKKYKDELDEIFMTEDMKKRILNNVLNKNMEAKSTRPRVKKYNSIRRNIELVAACFTAVICLSVVKNYPEVFQYKNINFEQNQVIKDSDPKHEIINSDVSSDENYKKSNSAKNEGNGNLYNNEKSSKIEQKAKNSTANSGVPSKKNAEQQTNTITSNQISLGNNSKDEKKNQDGITSNNKGSSGLDRPPLLGDSGYFTREYKTLEEAEEAMKLKINPVKVLPKGFNIDNIKVILNEIIQIKFSNGQEGITFRAGKGIDNISGNYNEYEIKKTCKVNGINVNIEGHKNKEFNLATWQKEGISYSISLTNSIGKEAILDIIESNL